MSFVLSGAPIVVLSGANDSCYQAHERLCSPCGICVSDFLNLYNKKRITVVGGCAPCRQNPAICGVLP